MTTVSGLDTTLAAIDAAVGCQRCGGTLGDLSRDFCGEDCQAAWHADRSVPLPSEPVAPYPGAGRYTVQIEIDCTGFIDVVRRTDQQVATAWRERLRWTRPPS